VSSLGRAVYDSLVDIQSLAPVIQAMEQYIEKL